MLYCIALHYIALYCIKTETKHISFIPVCPLMVKLGCNMVKVCLHCKYKKSGINHKFLFTSLVVQGWNSGNFAYCISLTCMLFIQET